MPLTNSQYDEIIRAYDARQLKNEHDREERTRYAVSYTHLTLPTTDQV